jgi:hypothetical protein
LIPSGIRISLFYQFCDVAIVATIHKRKEPILVTVQRGQAFYFSGEQGQSAKNLVWDHPQISCEMLIAHAGSQNEKRKHWT